MSQLPARVDVVVIGAGLAGLAAARHLHAKSFSVAVLESQDDVGGRVRTDIVDGFRLDRGFQIMLTAYPELRRQVDLAALDIHNFDPGALVMMRGRSYVVSDPFRAPRTLLGTLRAPIGSLADKARIAMLRARTLRGDPRELLRGQDLPTVVALRRAGFSQTMINRFFRPLFGGIQLDPSLATSRRMFDIIFRSLGEGDAGVPRLGMNALPRQMAARLPGLVHLNTAVASIDGRTVVTTDARRIEGRAVIVATELPAARSLVALPERASRRAGAVYFAADKPPTSSKLVILDGSGKGPVLNAAVMSNVAPSYAPAGKHLVVAAMPEVIDGDLESLAREQMRSWWGSQVDAWRHLRTYRIAHAGVEQRPPFNPKRNIALGNGVFVCGDHRDTGSLQGAMFSGRRCGELVAGALA
ncbi:MAG: FAD-dependent oxidoreductase [Actinobacteria bacterium]|nr:FAD-dependent oxidoreductase [Actinomycetota bacterium]MBM3817084.1 FAD-dependent oxidoreductase [Actinomycetota bacterium]